LLLIPAIVHAQAYQCRTPQAVVSVPSATRDGPVRQRPIRGYTLAASWSPEYCRSHRGPADARQCSGKSGRFGFVAHGLWPESRGGGWPQWCPTQGKLTGAELARNLCMTPSERLLATEWAKHGACMTGRPETYFKVTRILWSSLRWPDFDRLARSDGLTAGAVRRAFADANGYWEPAHVGVVLNERGWLEELRLCYGKDFMPTACDSRRFGAKDSVPVSIWRGL
jgi:ribonuclease T2